jgi:hypothetical protein
VINRLKETLLNELVAGGPVLVTPEPSAREHDFSTGATTAHRHHPQSRQLEGFVRGGLSRPEARAIVRHLLRGCDECRRVVRQVWALGNRESIEAGNEPARETN